MIDHATLFDMIASPCVVLDPNLIIVDMNRAYLEATGHRSREDLVGRQAFQAFPANPAAPDGAQNLEVCLRRVLATGEPDTIGPQRYDIPTAGAPDGFKERWWLLMVTPVPGPGGRAAWILLQSEDVTDYIKAQRSARPGTRFGSGEKRMQAMEAEVYVQAHELQRLNQVLRHDHARERQVAVTLQEAMLQTPDLGRHGERLAVRYVPATPQLNVCGDWYDVVDLPPDQLALTVGDVVGHGLEAAAVMGMLRSALSSAVRAVRRAAPSLEVLGLYSRSVQEALGTTVVNLIIDVSNQMISYSSAGHPPPLLAHRENGCELLDQATDPPLGVRPLPSPRPQTNVHYRPGDTLVLYTDGLIERRGEDIDTGLHRLTEAVTEGARLDPEQLADDLLERLCVNDGADDDVALIVARL